MFRLNFSNLFYGRSLAASKRASFVNQPGDTSSADKVRFFQLFRSARSPVTNHGDYGVFLGGNGLYPSQARAQVIAHMTQPVSKLPTVGIAFQDIQPGIKKGG